VSLLPSSCRPPVYCFAIRLPMFNCPRVQYCAILQSVLCIRIRPDPTLFAR
jgi:hypothetical protein